MAEEMVALSIEECAVVSGGEGGGMIGSGTRTGEEGDCSAERGGNLLGSGN